MDGAVAKDACLHEPVRDEIAIYLERIVLKVNWNLVQLQALAVLWRTAAVACRRIWQLEYGRITACIADHIEIRVAEGMREQLVLGVPAVKEQDDLALRKDRHDFIEELSGKSQFRILTVAHDVANRDCDIADLLLASHLVQDGHAHR